MRMLATGIMVVVCLAVSACAGTSGTTRGISGMDAEVDYGKVIAVNDWAVRRHATVVWINYPKKSARPNDDG